MRLFWETFKKSFYLFYEYSFILVFVNLTWFFLSGLFVFIGYGAILSRMIFLLIIPAVFLGPLFLSGLHIADVAARERQVIWVDFLKGIKNHFKRGLKGFIFSIIVYIVLILDFYIIFQVGLENVLMLILFGILLYISLFFSMSQLYFWGLLTCREDDSMFSIFKHSLIFCFDNILFAFLWLIIVVALTLIMIRFSIIFPAFFMGLIGLFIMNGTRLTLEQY